MKLTPIIEELRAECSEFENRVFGVAEFAQIAESMDSAGLPAAFVLPMEENTEEPRSTTRYMQTVKANFAVVVVVTNQVDEEGLNAWEYFDDMKASVFKAILGSDDTCGKDWIQYEGLSIVAMNRAFLAVQLEFSHEYDILDKETRHGQDIDRLGRFERMHVSVDILKDGKPDEQIEAKQLINLETDK